MTPLLECRGITKNYDHFPALKFTNLMVNRGRIVGLLGPNGSGKTTLIKLISGLLTPTSGEVLVNGLPIGIETKKVVSYLPERTYLPNWMKVSEMLDFFSDFYTDFNRHRAEDMLNRLQIHLSDRMSTMSKGTREKVQLILVMSRDADLYLLDEPIGGVDPAARDYILNTIITNYSENSTVIISTHLIADIETVLDDVLFLKNGEIVMASAVDTIREQQGKSVDQLFREVFKC